MNNNVWKELIGRLYEGFHNTTEVMAVIGYKNDIDQGEGVDVVEYIEYYTSHDESEVLGNFREIVRGMAKYSILRGDKARFVVVHNHPQGTEEASESDRLMAQRFQVATRLMGATMMGSYIYIDRDTVLLVGSQEEEFTTRQIRMRNMYPSGENTSFDRAIVRSTTSNISQMLINREEYGVRLNEAVVDSLYGEVTEEEGTEVIRERFGIIELNETNDIQAVYELNKMQPNIDNRRDDIGRRYRFGMSLLFHRGSPRYVVYDKREDVERDELGLAPDTRAFIKSMGLVGYPVTFYIG